MQEDCSFAPGPSYPWSHEFHQVFFSSNFLNLLVRVFELQKTADRIGSRHLGYLVDDERGKTKNTNWDLFLVVRLAELSQSRSPATRVLLSRPDAASEASGFIFL